MALIIFFIVTFGEDAALSPYRRVFISEKSATKEKKRISPLKRLSFFESPILSGRLRPAIAMETVENYIVFGSPYAPIWPAFK